MGPLDEFRMGYRDGKVLERGKVTFSGRRAFRLLISRKQPDGSRYRTAYYVDRETYLPLGTRGNSRLTIGGRSTQVRTRSLYTLYERLPDTRVNRKRLQIHPHPGARRVDSPAFMVIP